MGTKGDCELGEEVSEVEDQVRTIDHIDPLFTHFNNRGTSILDVCVLCRYICSLISPKRFNQVY